jgi:hypothetical protein
MTFRAEGGVELLIDSTRIFAARSEAIWLFMSASKGDITIVTKKIVNPDFLREASFHTSIIDDSW